MERDATFYVNKVKYLLFLGIFHYFLIFFIIIDIFDFLIAFGIFGPGMGENVKKIFFGIFPSKKYPFWVVLARFCGFFSHYFVHFY